MILLACATALECSKALSRVEQSCATEESGPVHFRGRVFLPCETGIGPVAAALSVGRLLERHRGITGILNVGICGSFDTALAPLGAACVASAEIWPEYGVHGSEPGGDDAFGHQMFANLNLDPVNRLELDPMQAAKSMNLNIDPKWPTGPSLTVAGVSGDAGRAQTLPVLQALNRIHLYHPSFIPGVFQKIPGIFLYSNMDTQNIHDISNLFFPA